MAERTRGYWYLALFIIVVFCISGLGSLAMRWTDWQWYASLSKPPWTPPSWLFGPVWTALYLTMAVAGWLVWRRRGTRKVAAPLVLFAVQLALNAVWTTFFFVLESPLAGLADIVVLWVAILATIIAFWRVRRPAAALLLPYLAWVSYAAALNLAIWRMNA